MHGKKKHLALTAEFYFIFPWSPDKIFAFSLTLENVVLVRLKIIKY